MLALKFQSVRYKFQFISRNQTDKFTACRTLESAKKLSAGVKNAHPISLDVTDEKALDAEVAKHDLVISLIPYTFHATVIKSAIKSKKNVVTTSYVSPAMLELDEEVKKAGITVMNEIGLVIFSYGGYVFYVCSGAESCFRGQRNGFHSMCEYGF
jgi:hypothetical protein